MTHNNHNYRVEALRSGDWWAITVPAMTGVFSQAKRLDQVEAHAREAIALMLDVDEDDITLDVHIQPPPTVADDLQALQTAANEATEAASAASQLRYKVAQTLQDEGFALRDVGYLIGISHQRVSQVLAGK